jgi:hypothetical protein
MEPMDRAGGDVEADARADRNRFTTERRLAQSREKGDGLFDRVRVQQNPVSRPQPLLGDEEPLRTIPR